MFWNAKNGCVTIGETKMHYASFGKGSKAFLVLPGLSDGLTTVKGKALLLFMFSAIDTITKKQELRL